MQSMFFLLSCQRLSCLLYIIISCNNIRSLSIKSTLQRLLGHFNELFKMIYNVWIFYSKLISIRFHSEFEFVIFVEKDDLFSCKLVTKNAVFACLLQQAKYDDNKRICWFFWLENYSVHFWDINLSHKHTRNSAFSEYWICLWQ